MFKLLGKLIAAFLLFGVAYIVVGTVMVEVL